LATNQLSAKTPTHVQQLLEERQTHEAAIAHIDEVLQSVGCALGATAAQPNDSISGEVRKPRHRDSAGVGRLLTHVDEVIADGDPREPFDWFRSFEPPEKLGRGHDRCLLFLGFDASRKRNTVGRMLRWFGEFQKMLAKDGERLAATVFVLDWPAKPEGETSESKLTDEDIDRLMHAGICYRPKDERFYEKRSGGLAKALQQDLLSKGLIPEHLETLLDEPVPAKPAPDEKNPEVREASEFLGSEQFVWPPEAVRELFRR
jgi:hypothetical protein